MLIESFKSLRVYKTAFESTSLLSSQTKTWPPFEQYSLTQQILRSSRSVCSNIGEAWFKKKYPKHFVSKISDAGSEAMETIVWLDLALELEYLDSALHKTLIDNYTYVISGLIIMSNQPHRRCFRDGRERRMRR